MTREPFWWPTREPPLPYADLTPAQAAYYAELEFYAGSPELTPFREIIERTKHETRIRNGIEANEGADKPVVETKNGWLYFIRNRKPIDPRNDLEIRDDV